MLMELMMASERCSSYVLWNVIVLMELMIGLRGVFILCSLECDSADGTHDGSQRVFILCSLECDGADGTHGGLREVFIRSINQLTLGVVLFSSTAQI